jgi:RNA polymerase sigma factor (sigma-70 family)
VEKDSLQEALQPVSEKLVGILVKNRERFRSYLTRRVGSEAIAEELLQQSLLKALEADDSLRNEESLIPWFYRVLKNALIDYYRSHSKEERRDDSLLKDLEALGETKSPPADELKAAICHCLGGLLPTLNPGYAELVQKIDLDQASPEAVAKELGITTNNLGVKLHRARQALRKSLERGCGACAQHSCLDCTCKP